MKIKSLSITNYKCFYGTQNINLEPGFNLFIGKNNSGKTTALELIDLLPHSNNEHKSILNIVTYGQIPTEKSECHIELHTSFNELLRIFGGRLNIPLPKALSSNTPDILEKIKNDQSIKIRVVTKNNARGVFIKTTVADYVELQENQITLSLTIDQKDNENELSFDITNQLNSGKEVAANFNKINNNIYRFTALRSPNARHSISSTNTLQKSASNIAFCINHLQSNDAEGHRILCELINRIFPEVHWIQSTPINNEFELRCLPTPRQLRRDDLAIPIDQMGTGIGNVISILYVILTSRFPQVIAIDEPNSFLHPKALRELLQILESHGKQHQYILTGHSPEVLTAIEPSTITYFEIKDSSSKVKQFTKNQYHEFRSELSDLGIRMTDLHAKDRVLWVEGQTEEIVFPKLLREYCPEISAGTAVLRVTHTGSFETGKVHINEVAITYMRLTQTSLAPPMVAIVLDTEDRKQQDIEKITRENNKLIHFLPYRMIENYVLDADAILAVLKTYQIDANLAAVVAQLPSNENIQNADGAKILKEIFTTSSDATYEFRKTTHTPELFDWLLENKKDNLKPLELFIQSICATTL